VHDQLQELPAGHAWLTLSTGLPGIGGGGPASTRGSGAAGAWDGAGAVALVPVPAEPSGAVAAVDAAAASTDLPLSLLQLLQPEETIAPKTASVNRRTRLGTILVATI
jgi:hypothetical protein